MGLYNLYLLAREVRRLEVSPEGGLRFVRLLGTTTLQPSDVRRIETGWVYDGDSQTFLEIVVSTDSSTERIPTFHGAEDVFRDLALLNEAIDTSKLDFPAQSAKAMKRWKPRLRRSH
jgi:hypothetical protein